MPLPPDVEQSLQEIRAWEQEHPGHCGRCCLPFAHCYHSNPGFRSEMRQLNHIPSEFFRLVQEWHERTLRVMPTAALLALPEPRRPSKQLALVEELRVRGEAQAALNAAWKEQLQERLTYLTRYQRLMADEAGG